ncbi:MAG: DUF4174 domain-containing protein [Myxococcota bacterium]
MDDFAWSKRVLVVFCSDASQWRDAWTASLNADADGLRERDLVVLDLDTDPPNLDGQPLHRDDVATLRARFEPRVGACEVALVGKDGGEKLRQRDAAVSLTDLMLAIDAMPMRQQEMRGRSQPTPQILQIN